MGLLLDAPDGCALIEPANWRDLNILRKLEAVCFPNDAWPLLDLIGVLTLPNIIRLRAMVANNLIGFIAADLRPSEHVAWIATIAVLPEFRRQGLGNALLHACEEKLSFPLVRLSVRITNHPAISLYEKAGYKDIEIWSNYYQDGEDALVMEKQLL
jgi:ribosomal protein S18 acetylase RimI-like enzyme